MQLRFQLRSVNDSTKKTKNYDDIDIPNIVLLYNKLMGGVDLHDQIIAYYRKDFRLRKYYFCLLFHMIDMCVINSWLFYKRSLDKINVKRRQQNSLSKFKLRLSTSLMLSRKTSIKKRRTALFFKCRSRIFPNERLWTCNQVSSRAGCEDRWHWSSTRSDRQKEYLQVSRM